MTPAQKPPYAPVTGGSPVTEMTTSSDRLTAEMVRAAVEKIKADRGYHVCGSQDNHVVHPTARGWTTCANCFGTVWVGPDA